MVFELFDSVEEVDFEILWSVEEVFNNVFLSVEAVVIEMLCSIEEVIEKTAFTAAEVPPLELTILILFGHRYCKCSSRDRLPNRVNNRATP